MSAQSINVWPLTVALTPDRIREAAETLTAAFREADFPGARGQADPQGAFIEAKRNLIAFALHRYGTTVWEQLIDALEDGPIAVNLNDHVLVRLTDKGRAMLADRGRYAKEIDGWSDWQLWDLMHEFGADLRMGFGPHPFDPTFRLARPSVAEDAT